MVVLGPGIMVDKYRQYASVIQLDLDTTPEHEIISVVNKLKGSGINNAIVNTTVSGRFVPYLKNAGLQVVSLIHELPSILRKYRLEEHASCIEKYADKVIFPAKQVQDGFEHLLPGL